MLVKSAIQNINELSLELNSTLQDLHLWNIAIDVEKYGNELVALFDNNPLLPGVIVTKNHDYITMISRHKFFEHMSRPYSLGLFSQRPIESLCKMLSAEVFVLPENTNVTIAIHKALERSPKVVYEPILVEFKSGEYGVLDFHHLLQASSQIHVLTLLKLQQSEDNFRKKKTESQQIKNEYAQFLEKEKMADLGKTLTSIASEVSNPINSIAGNVIHVNRYIQQLIQIINLYQIYYPQPATEIQTEIEKIDLYFVTNKLPKLLTHIKKSVKQIKPIFNYLLNLSLIDESQQKRINIHECIDNSLGILQSRLNFNPTGEKISVIKKYEKLPRIDCYPGLLNLVFMKILSNAIDALESKIKKGGFEIKNEHRKIPKSMFTTPTIQIHTQILDNHYLLIHIRDNGIGIKEEIRQKIFDPFFTNKPLSNGTGTGLSVCYQIVVEKHGGQIECISTPGKDTEFIIKIPIDSGDRTAER
ncbi:MAG: ATP-binding protein [Nostocaceae cyanobacterium]|nr:ATP-binding protein [Nostocaceae cyanobacterium]